MEPLGARKPSELLNHMLELCPRGEEKNKFFLFLFLQRMPKELRVLLTEADLTEPRDLATKADRHWAMLTHQTHGMIAEVEAEAEEPGINAVNSSARGRQRGRSGRGRGHGGHVQQQTTQPDGQQTGAPTHPTAPGALARFSTGLCHFHWT
jgi:hypothetical protein